MVEVEALQEILLQLQTVEDHSEVVVAVQAALAEPGAREVLGVPSATAEAEQEAAEAVEVVEAVLLPPQKEQEVAVEEAVVVREVARAEVVA